MSNQAEFIDRIAFIEKKLHERGVKNFISYQGVCDNLAERHRLQFSNGYICSIVLLKVANPDNKLETCLMHCDTDRILTDDVVRVRNDIVIVDIAKSISQLTERHYED